MSDSYILHDVMRKVKADGLFDSIRRDLISDIEQKQSYLDLKSQIESLMSSYLSEYKWSSTLKKSDLREKARRHIETSNLIKDRLPTLVNEYMQTCQEQLVQPRISSFVSDHLDNIYNSIGGTHIYRPTASFTQSISVQQESIKQEKPTPAPPPPPPPPPPPQSPASAPVKKESVQPKPNKNLPSSNINKQKIIPKKKPLPPPPPPTPTTPSNPIKEEKKTRVLSPVHSPSDLIDISPSPPSIENEQATTALSPSPPPPVVRIASPLRTQTSTETPRKTKRVSENNEEKKKKVKTEEPTPPPLPQNLAEDVESDTRKLRSRRPNPKYSNEQYETEDLNILEASTSPPTTTKTKKSRQLKPSTSSDTPSSPPPAPPAPPPPTSIESSQSINEMSPEYGTSASSSTIEKQPTENVEIQSRSPSPMTNEEKKFTSPRRLRPRRTHKRSTNPENQSETTPDLPTQTSTKKSRHPSSSTGDSNSNEMPTRSNSVPDNPTINTEDTQVGPISPATAPVSKSFIWKPKISK